jgi:hypothetical protein
MVFALTPPKGIVDKGLVLTRSIELPDSPGTGGTIELDRPWAVGCLVPPRISHSASQPRYFDNWSRMPVGFCVF